MKKLINQRTEWQRIELNCSVSCAFGSVRARVRMYVLKKKKIEGGVTSLTFPSSCSDWLLFEEAHGFFQLISASPSL